MDNSRFPNRLKKFRRLFRFSQKDVAKKLGLKDTSPLSRWEKGLSLPNLLHVFRLSRIYKTLPSELYLTLWHHTSKEIGAVEDNLVTQKESISNNEV